MNIVIIEDEIQTARDLRESLERLRPDFQVKAVIDSIESAMAWFSINESPDLIFSDIQLGDGLSFEIFKQITITCPVIFCTAFDEYAVQAFKNNGIDYLLKPVSDKDLASTLEKMEVLMRSASKGGNN
ncbi:MAG TPA: response regulator, partial [Cyclobacteriaceae bacterium]